jgi:glycine/D-amino acid oxidase-like deaminating enzyme
VEPVLEGASHWQLAAGLVESTRPALDGVVDADVCIIGAGYTGLWTAWALLSSDAPPARVVLVEARYAGFGASGRNGGWLSGLLPGNRSLMAARGGGRDGVVALQRALIDAVATVGSIVDKEQIECDFHPGGTLAIGRTQAQMARLRGGWEADREWGLTDQDVRILDSEETAARIRVEGAVGSVFNRHCARIQPARLAGGLATLVERLGGVIYERTAASSVEVGRVVCPSGEVRAPWVVVATEGYTASLAGRRRRLLPMNSSMIVTAPLPDSAWASIGWDGAETASDGGHYYVYMQRTADGRIAIGGRGVPYRYGSVAGRSAVSGAALLTPPATVSALEGALRDMFPGVAASRLQAERAWSGVLGVARDWCPSIVLEGAAGSGAGVVTAGGYVGDGVTTSHLAGVTVADLVLGRDTAATRLPWVGHRSRRWEPEPLRWIGINAVYRMYRAADRSEARRPGRRKPSRWAVVAGALAGME